jgi:spore maturation protein CgeB
VGELASIVVFPTPPTLLNSHPERPRYVASALRRVAPPGIEVIEAPIEAARDAIASLRPSLALGIGSVARGESDFAALWRVSQASGTTLAYWLHNEPYEFDFTWRVLESCHWLFGNDRTALDHYGPDNVSHLPLAASLDHHFREPVPLVQRRHDVFFCGYGYPNRQDLLARLQRRLEAAGTQVLGDGWPATLPFCHNRRLGSAEMTTFYNDSRLTLNIGRHYDLANRRFELVASTPGPRTFEGAAAGALQAVFREGLEMFDSYRLGTEILAFDTVAGFADLLDDVLARPQAYDAVIRAAQARTRADHTYDVRVRDLLATLGGAGLGGRVTQ